MKDLIRVFISSELDNLAIFEIFKAELSEFIWRMGESDVQGEYVSGVNSDKVYIEIWTSENPMDLMISFRSSKADAQENAKTLDKIMGVVSSKIGAAIIKGP